MTLSRVLLVDDNDEVSALFQEGLENYGFDVVVAWSARRALSLTTSEQFDVLLYDLHKPDASDVFVVVNALLHIDSSAVLLVLGRYPAQGGLSALLLKPDVVEESRILQLTIFKTLQDNLRSVDFSKVLLDVRTIRDEVDSQLKQQILGAMSSKSAKSAAA
jgi:DNA-binding NarL/FixJ family response regulator